LSKAFVRNGDYVSRSETTGSQLSAETANEIDPGMKRKASLHERFQIEKPKTSQEQGEGNRVEVESETGQTSRHNSRSGESG
jgi:hypothetical protein